MGNKIARTTQASATEYYLHDLPSSYNLVLKEVLGRDRFLKSILCKHDEGLVLVKVYFKRGDSIGLRDHERRLARIRDIFSKLDHPHVWPFQFWLETDKAAYLLRQYFFNNLHDRLSTRPFLSLVEKKWLSFQLLYAVKQSHEHGVCHGDIKCENVLVTSWNWLYLADFASFKPTYIPYDDPSDFSFFFDTGGRRRCYVAPERFYEHGGETQVAQDANLKPSMDIFSVGCVIAELFLEGQPLFELSQLLAYRRGQFDPTQHLEKIPDSGIRKMILHMIQLDPESRCSAESYLQNYAGVVFPSYFSPFLHKFYSLLNPLSCDARVLACETSFQEILRQMLGNRTGDDVVSETEMSNNDRNHLLEDGQQGSNGANKSSDERKETNNVITRDRFDLLDNMSTLLRDVKLNNGNLNMKIMQDSMVKAIDSHDDKQCGLQSPGEVIQSISNKFLRSHHPFLKKITMTDLSTLISDFNNQSDTFGMPFLPLPQDILSCEGMVLIASLLCSCIRNVKVPFIRRAAVLLLKSCSLYIDDDDRLQRILPYVIAVLSDPAAIVRCAALETLCDILPLVRDFPPSDAKIFPEYILPMLSMLPDDPEESVRICYGSNISKLALTAYGFLIHSISLTEAGVLNENLSRKSSTPASDSSGEPQRLNNDALLGQLRKSIAEVIQELVMGPKQTPNIRRALLQDIGNLCWFFGQKQSNDFLLPILPAFLNDRDEQLRTVFYGQIIYVCFFVGQRSVEEYLLPYIEQALNDTTESVIVNALDCLAILCRSSFLRKRILLEMIERAFPLLCYPSKWVRRATVTFIAASSENLGAVDSYVFLVPVIRPFLRRQPASLASEKALLGCLKPPVSREVYHQVLENTRSSDMLERQRKIWYNASSQSRKLEAADLLQKTAKELDPMKCMSDRQNDFGHHSFSSTAGEHFDSTKFDDNEGKFKSMGNLMQNSLSQEEAHDRVASEKSQLSGFMSPQMSCMNSFIDKSSESIPLYHFKFDNRRTSTNAAAVPDSSLPYNSLGLSTSLPWMDPVNKSFSLASSIPAPKLVTGSVYVGNGPALLRRVVHEVDDRETDETAFVSSKFHEKGVSDRIKGSTLTIADNSMSVEATESTSLAWSSTIPDSGWRPRGVLVAHLQEHRSAVNDISISMDQQFFVSASEDSTVKIWDCKKLEKDISFRSRLTYSLGGSRAMCVAVLQGTTQIVVGASDGMMHMFSVDHISRGLGNVVENYSGITDVKKTGFGEGAILSLLNYSADGSTSQMILYSTQNCGVHLWDTRTNSNSWNTKVSPEEGYISSLVADPCGNWFVSGSSRGVLTLWDLRFCIPVNTWQYSLPCPIEKMCLFVPPSGTPLSVATRPLVYVAAGCNEVSLWNAENGSCHQILRAANLESDAGNCESPWALTRPSSKTNTKSDPRRSTNSKYRLDELNEPSIRVPGIRALLPLPGGDLLTGGTDLKIRRWDHCSPERTYCVCGPSIEGIGNDDFYETKSSFGVQVVQEAKRRPLATRLTGKAILAAAATDSAGCHHDSILSLASVKLNQRLLISSSRDGALKVWK